MLIELNRVCIALHGYYACIRVQYIFIIVRVHVYVCIFGIANEVDS